MSGPKLSVLKAAARLCNALNKGTLADFISTRRDRSKKCGRFWRGGRVVEGASLENWNTGNRIGGSNPSLSAITFVI